MDTEVFVFFTVSVSLFVIVTSFICRILKKRIKKELEESRKKLTEQIKEDGGFEYCECEVAEIFHFIDGDGYEGWGLFVKDDDGDIEFQELYPPIYEDDEPDDTDSNEDEAEAKESE